MKRILNWTVGIVVSAMIVGAALALNAWYFKPILIDTFFERVFAKEVLLDPERLTQLGIAERFGYTRHHDELTDASPDHQRRVAEFWRRELATLRSYDRRKLNGDEALSYDILEFYMSDAVAGEPWLFHDYPVNQFDGVQNDLPSFMLDLHTIEDGRSARDYVTRLQKFSVKFEQVLTGLRLRESQGVIPPRFVIDHVLRGMREFVAPPSREHVLYRHLVEALAELDDIDASDRDTLLASAAKAIDEDVYPAYRSLIAFFEAAQSHVSEDYGVWKLPDGDAYYDHLVRHYTTTDLDAETVHARGLAEVARIEGEMNTVLARIGRTKGTVGARLAELTLDPAQLYSNDDAGRAACIADFQRIIDEAETRVAPAFERKPDSKVAVQRVPTFREATSSGASYMRPALDGSRPGVFFINLRDMAEIPRYGMRTLAYHEAIPGHHFQIALSQSIQSTPTFRRVIPFTAFSEGWALYAERLAWELGLMADPLDDLGRLQAEMFRATRLVVDTGIHRKRWTRSEAIAYMLAKTGMAEGDVTNEIERYFVMPGQALSYKIGMMRMLELREQARDALRERFDLRGFHDTVLMNGALPLGVLESRVEAWVESRRSNQT